jgi:hypothetical protein
MLSAVDEITQADIPHATRTNALRLLRLAHPDNGHVALTWTEATALCEVSPSTLRRQLGQMAAAHLIHYSTNGDGYVYCTFKAWIRREVSKISTVDARGRAGTVEKFDSSAGAPEEQARVDAREPSKNSTVDARGRAIDAHSLSRASAPDLTDRLTDYDPTGQISQSVTADEYRRTKALLRDIRIDGPDAHRIARLHPFERVRDCVAAWWMNRKSVGGKLQNGPGIVLFWLDNWPGKPPNHYEPADWRREDLYRQHRTPAEVAAGERGDQGDDEAERRRKYIPDEFSDIAIG